MSRTLQIQAAAALLLGVSTFAAPSPAMAQSVVPVDVETQLGGIDVACTGIGADARAELRWQAYGVRVEFSNARNEYLVGGEVTVRDARGVVLLDARCDAPWLLMRLAPSGQYVVEGRMGPEVKSARVTPPRTGQMRVVLQFPDS